ncbi:sigma-70 family RNA polymerase sigma factor [Methylocella sp. CPCC 101449]|uniref:sigma-70 family RNA polymerase sigma factor n=1 Tax=Methylocella sp. CPCC 101449 TaxID=2987531 RepID=UPI00288E67F0|nr:sigma-70 family RNA polymerase sigma factor [Methylocella sp. CPCC 101449]MDT2022123.1 sigma-70 family RNA polymerase sigma factor [Methylocella sp. CPCC 101449]
MTEENFLAQQFDQKRGHLRAVAYRMLGSLPEAEDAVQETWLRLARSDTGDVDNLGGWLTTAVARVCLDMLRQRKARREEAFDDGPEPAASGASVDPDQEMAMADAVGLALMVVLEKLAPAERIAFVLHDMFDISFDDIAPIVQRSPVAARQLASRARRRVQGTEESRTTDRTRQRQVVEAFLAASRGGDFAGLLAVLAPDVAFHADPVAARLDAVAELRGAQQVATAFKGRARSAFPALINGTVGALVAPRGKLLVVLAITVEEGRIVGIEAIADPQRLATLDVRLLK